MVQINILYLKTPVDEIYLFNDLLTKVDIAVNFQQANTQEECDEYLAAHPWHMIVSRLLSEGEWEESLAYRVVQSSYLPVIIIGPECHEGFVQRILNQGVYRYFTPKQVEFYFVECVLGWFKVRERLVDQKTLATENQEASLMPGFLNSGDLFSKVFSASSLPMCINSLEDGRFLAVNKALEDLLGYSQKDLLGVPPHEIGKLVELDRFRELQKTNLKVGRIPPAEIQMQGTDGKLVVYLVSTEIVDFNGHWCSITIAQDISEQKKAEAVLIQLRKDLEARVEERMSAIRALNRGLELEEKRRKEIEKEEQQLAQILWETPDVVAILDNNYRLTYLNKAGLDLFQIENVHDLDSNAILRFPIEIRSLLQNRFQPDFVMNGTWRGESKFLLPNGKSIPVSLVVITNKDQQGNLHFATVARDISELKGAVDQIRKSEEKYRQLAEAARDIIFVVDLNERVEYINSFAASAMQVDQQSAIGRPLTEILAGKPWGIGEEKLQDLVQNGKPIYSESEVILEEKPFWLGTWLIPIKNSESQVGSILGMARDITQSKTAERTLQQALADQIEINDLRTKFLSMTSHEFRTPLSAILSSAELLSAYGNQWSQDKRNEHFHRIENSARRLDRMFDDFLLVGQIEAGRLIYSPEPINIRECLEGLIRELDLFHEHEHQISIVELKECAEIMQDERLIRQVVGNLVNNAMKFASQETEIRIEYFCDAVNLVLRVVDRGPGIPASEIPYIFDAYHRGDKVMHTSGVGLGLTIVKKAVEMMQGKILVHSEEGHGATFEVTIPRQPQ